MSPYRKLCFVLVIVSNGNVLLFCSSFVEYILLQLLRDLFLPASSRTNSSQSQEREYRFTLSSGFFIKQF